MINFYTQADYQSALTQLRTINDADFKETMLVEDQRSLRFFHSGILVSLGLDYPTAEEFFKDIDNQIRREVKPNEYDLANNLANQFKAKYIDKFAEVKVIAPEEPASIAKPAPVEDPDPHSIGVGYETSLNPDEADTAELPSLRKKSEIQTRESWSEEEKTHYACGILKYIYDLNQKRLLAAPANQGQIPSHKFTDKSGKSWQSSSVSFIGTHTHGVNSDAVLKQPTEHVLAAVADGVTCPYYPKIDADQLVDPRIYEYSSKTAANALINSLGCTNLIPSWDGNHSAPHLNEIQSETKKTIIEDPEHLMILIGSYNHQINEDLKNTDLSTWLAGQAELMKRIADNETKYRGLDQTLLQDAEVKAALLTADLARRLESNLRREFRQTHTNDYSGKGLAASSTLSCALDLGDYIGFIAKGDSPIIVFGHNDEVLKQTPKMTDFGDAFTAHINPNGERGSDYRSYFSERVFVCKKSDVKGFAIMSDGVAENKHLEQFVKYIKSGNGLANPQAFVSAALDYSLRIGSHDDQSIQVVMAA